jgi:hypothetical protein
MPGKVVTKKLTFDATRQSRVVHVTMNTSPEEILDGLNLFPLPRGIISISGGAKEFPPPAIERTMALVGRVIVPITYKHNLLIVDGGTEAGVMKITGEAFRSEYPPPRVMGGASTAPDEDVGQDGLPLLGVVPRPRVNYPGIDHPSTREYGLDPNHFYFVLVSDAQDWGEEVDCMFAFLDYLAIRRQIPVVNIVANGGRITIKEAFHAVENGWPVVVWEGSHRAAEVIIAALDGASRQSLIDLLSKCEVRVHKSEIQETLHWLGVIGGYERIDRFDFMSGSFQDLRESILAGLGLGTSKPKDIE